MQFSFLSNVIVISALCFTSFGASAATAYAQVTVNIVPMSTVSTTGNIVLGEQSIKNSSGNVEISTLNTNNTAKLKISARDNTAYSLSISSTAKQPGDTKGQVLVKNLEMLKDTGVSNTDEEYELHMAGTVNQSAIKDTGLYSAETEITVNYN